MVKLLSRGGRSPQRPPPGSVPDVGTYPTASRLTHEIFQRYAPSRAALPNVKRCAAPNPGAAFILGAADTLR